MAEKFQAGKNREGNGRDREKQLFFLILLLSFLAVFIFNFFTPMLSDDYAYAMEVQKAGSILDLFRQEYHQYMTWNGRSVVHLILRMFLYLPAPAFKVANSIAFIVVSFLMYKLTLIRKRYDCWTLLMVQMGLWLYAVDFSETVLWEDGACNYLWGAMLILLFMTLERGILERESSTSRKKEKRFSGPLEAVLMLLFGVIAGWCNENTSGGCLLYLLILGAWKLRDRRRQSLSEGGNRENSSLWDRKGLPVSYVAGICGNVLGLAVMVLSPGGRLRASYAEEENYQGFLGLLARIQKITLVIHEYFGVLLAAALVCLILLALQKNRRACQQLLLYLFLFAATSYALMLTRQTQPRAFFGAGLFLLIGVIGAIRRIMTDESLEGSWLLRAAGLGILAILLLQFFFMYVEEGTNLARIWRDETNRIAYIEEQKEKGAKEITVPMVHTDFYNKYSAIEKMEMTDDPGYWINIFYEEYYGVPSIRAIPYDDWAAQKNG